MKEEAMVDWVEWVQDRIYGAAEARYSRMNALAPHAVSQARNTFPVFRELVEAEQNVDESQKAQKAIALAKIEHSRDALQRFMDEWITADHSALSNEATMQLLVDKLNKEAKPHVEAGLELARTFLTNLADQNENSKRVVELRAIESTFDHTLQDFERVEQMFKEAQEISTKSGKKGVSR